MDNEPDEINRAFRSDLQDPELLEFFPPDAHGVVTDFILRHSDDILARYMERPETHNGRLVTPQLMAAVVEEMLAETGAFVSELEERRQRREDRRKRYLALLPDLPGDFLVFHWHLECATHADFIKYYLLVFDGRTIHREEAFWEDFRIYLDMLWALMQKYGSRLMDFVPSNDYYTQNNMYGDDLSSPGVVADARRALAEWRQTPEAQQIAIPFAAIEGSAVASQNSNLAELSSDAARESQNERAATSKQAPHWREALEYGTAIIFFVALILLGAGYESSDLPMWLRPVLWLGWAWGLLIAVLVFLALLGACVFLLVEVRKWAIRKLGKEFNMTDREASAASRVAKTWDLTVAATLTLGFAAVSARVTHSLCWLLFNEQLLRYRTLHALQEIAVLSAALAIALTAMRGMAGVRSNKRPITAILIAVGEIMTFPVIGSAWQLRNLFQ